MLRKSLHILMSSALPLTLALSACAPKVEERVFEKPQTSFGPQSQDTRLNLRVRQFGKDTPELYWAGTIGSARFFEIAEALHHLGASTETPALKQTGLSWIRKYYSTPQATLTTELADSPFASLATSQTQEQVRGTLTEVLADIEKSRPVIRRHIEALGPGLPQVPIKNLNEILSRAEMFTGMVLAEIPNMGLIPVIESGLTEEFQKKTTPLFAEVRALLAKLAATKTLSETLRLIDDAVKQFEVELTPELQASMLQGRKLAVGLDRMSDAQSALTVIVDVWRMLTPAEREQNFKPVNETLYDFLSKQNEDELICLATEGCNGGIIDGITKKIFILPKIKKFGVETLQRDLNNATRQYVVTSIEAFAAEFVKTMPQTFADNIDVGLTDKAAAITRVRDGYQSYVRNLFKVWQKKVLPTTDGMLPGFEGGQVLFEASTSKSLNLKPAAASPQLRADSIGPAMSANVLLLEESPANDPNAFAAMLAQVNKLVAIAGYRDMENNLVPALLAPVNHEGTLLDIMNFDASKDPGLSFRVPDIIKLRDAYHADHELTYEKDFSAAAFASQIRGLSRMMRLTADWKKTAYDEQLGPIKAQDLTQDAQHEDLQQPLFPKDMLFALNLGNAAVLLQDITKKATPVFMLSLNNNLLWADSYGTTNETAVMAGIVDIKKGERTQTVSTRDTTNFLLALSEFLDATEGVENTKSSILLEKDANGEAPLDILNAGRKDMRLLILAISNFISNQLIKADKLAVTKMNLNERTLEVNKDYRVEQQALAIRALLKGWQITKIDSYLWSAQEVYYAMNRQMFNAKEEFYVNSDGSKLSLPERINTLLALSELKPHLPEESRIQLEKLMNPWLSALKNLK